MNTPPSPLSSMAAVGAALAAMASLATSSCCTTCWGSSAGTESETTQRLVGYRQVEEVVSNGDPKGGMPVVRIVQQPVYQEVRVRRLTSGGGDSPRCLSLFFPDHTACGSTGPHTMEMASAQGSTGAPQIGLIPTMRPLAD